MLPKHLPLKALESLIQHHSTLTASESEEYTPLEMLTGYYDSAEYGAMPFENPETDETDPMTRMQAGERLAIQLHLGAIQHACDFIDGQQYVATEIETANDEAAMDDARAFPDDSGFFGIGIWLDGDRLGLEPVRISGDMSGNVCVTRAVFPDSLAERTVAYLRALTRSSA